MEKKERTLGLLLVLAGLLVGNGVGQILEKTVGISIVGGATVIGLGVGFLAAFIYATMKKK